MQHSSTRRCERREGLRPLREHRFEIDLDDSERAEFREALVDLAGGFTEVDRGARTLCIVGLALPARRNALECLLERWGSRTHQGRVALERRPPATEEDDVFFLLPFSSASNATLPAVLGRSIASRFRCEPKIVRAYGEWRSEAGKLVAEPSLLIRLPRRGRDTLPAVQRFIHETVLAAPEYGQECIYLSEGGYGYLVRRDPLTLGDGVRPE